MGAPSLLFILFRQHELLVAQWDSLKVAWILLKEALERFEREELEQNHASTSRQ